MSLFVMDYSLAMAAGQDAANRQMRKAGRKRWNLDDWNESVRVFDRHYGDRFRVANGIAPQHYSFDQNGRAVALSGGAR